MECGSHMITQANGSVQKVYYPIKNYRCCTGLAHSQLWVTIIPVYFPYAPRKYDKRLGMPAIVRFTGRKYTYMPNIWFTGRKHAYMPNAEAIFPIEIISRK